MNRRTSHSPTKTPAFTGGEDRPEPACAGNWAPFDVLIDYKGGGERLFALREARQMCGSCPIAATCLRDNRDEKWAQDVMDVSPRGVPRVGVNRKRAEGALRKHATDREARAEALRALVARGASVEDACEELAVSYHALYKWCGKWGHDALWSALAGRSVAA